MGVPATLKVQIVGDARGVGPAVAETERGMARLAGGIRAAASAAAAFAAIKIVGAIASTTQAAADLGETMNKVNTLFKDAASKVQAFASGAAKTLGQSKQSALDAAATFAVFGKAAGLTGEKLADFSTGLTGLASDLASFHNTRPEDAIQALGAALRGEAEPMRRYGVLLDDASLRQEALRQGLISTTRQALTPQQKVLAANALIWKQTADAQGDFAKTADDLANKQRSLNARWEDAKASLGQAFLPLMLQAAGIFERLIPIIEANADVIAPLILGIGALTVAVMILNAALAPIEAFGLVAVLVVAAIAALAVGAVIAYQKIEPFRRIVDEGFRIAKIAVKAFMDTVRDGWAKLQPDLERLKSKFDELWRKLQPIFRDLEPMARRVGEFLGGSFVGSLSLAINWLSAMIDYWGWLIDKIKQVIDWLKRIKWPEPPSWLKKITGGGGFFGFSAPPGGFGFAFDPRGGDGAAGLMRALPRLSAAQAAAAGVPQVTVNVFVDDPRLRDLIRVEVDGAQTTLARRILAGRAL